MTPIYSRSDSSFNSTEELGWVKTDLESEFQSDKTAQNWFAANDMQGKTFVRA